MKISIWRNNRDIRLEERPIPEPGADEILVKVISCGICGSDISEWYRLPRAPLVLGHEIGAEVVKSGSNVKKFSPGDRVFVAPKVPCMECYYCENGHEPVCSNVKDRLPGGFAQFLVVPSGLVEKGTYLLPPTLSYDQSTFIEPLACVVRSQRLGAMKENRHVVVLGCGMSGLLHLKLAKARGCRTTAVDVSDNRLAFAKKVGADIVINGASNLSDQLVAAHGRKADVVMLCTSALPAITQAWQCVDKGGTIVFFAVPDPGKEVTIPINDFWMKEIRIQTSYYCGPTDIAESIKMIEEKLVSVEDMITHRLPLDDIREGFRLVCEAKDSIKVIIKPNN